MSTVKAAVDLTAEQNPGDFTTTAIAKRMGLTQGTLFRHFPSRETILQAVTSGVTERLLARVDKVAEGAVSPVAALESVFRTHIDFVSDHRGVPRMRFGELQRSGETLPKRMVQTLIHQYGERLCRLLESGKAQGKLDAPLDKDVAVVLFIGTIHGLGDAVLVGGRRGRHPTQRTGGVCHLPSRHRSDAMNVCCYARCPTIAFISLVGEVSTSASHTEAVQ